MKEPTIEYKKLDMPNNAKARRPCCTRRLVLFSVLIALLAVSASVFLFIGIGGVCCFPLHASCDISWKFTNSCEQIKSSLIKQINLWQTPDNCKDGGQKCLYKLVSHHGSLLKATHETPKKHYIDDLVFTFKQVGETCQVQGNSRSQLWYALLDMGTNYCNLHNLITGAGLDHVAGYEEVTSSTKCTQYTTADCEVY